MYENYAKNIRKVFNKNNEERMFAKDLRKCMYKFYDPDEFESARKELISKYGLANNNWMKELNDEKERWAMVNGRHVFGGGIRPT